jgi:4-hydroxy-3-polyprenylbenzoate decarboxylase
MKKMIVGISGASGVIYGIRLLEVLSRLDVETHLVISEAGCRTIRLETPYSLNQVRDLADTWHDAGDVGAAIASGSFLCAGMAVIPCSIKTLSGIANAYGDNLLIRAADVTLKERRRLVLVPRETPLHKGHLSLMALVADLGAVLLPPFPAFYHHPRTLDDIIDHLVGKVLDIFHIEHKLFRRWDGGNPQEPL